MRIQVFRLLKWLLLNWPSFYGFVLQSKSIFWCFSEKCNCFHFHRQSGSRICCNNCEPTDVSITIRKLLFELSTLICSIQTLSPLPLIWLVTIIWNFIHNSYHPLNFLPSLRQENSKQSSWTADCSQICFKSFTANNYIKCNLATRL